MKTWTGYAAFRRGELLWGCFDSEREIVERYQCACYANIADEDMPASEMVKAHGITVEQVTIFLNSKTGSNEKARGNWLSGLYGMIGIAFKIFRDWFK